MNKIKKILISFGRTALLIAISLIVGIRLYSWNAQNLAGNAMPMPFGIGMSVVLSGSMEPVLSVNDLVFVREAESYEVDDIVVYQDGSSLVIHKIISVDGDKVITKGEANDTADEPISADDIKGKAVLHIPFVGAFIRFFKTPVGFFIVIAASIVLFELPHLLTRRKVLQEQEKIKEEIRKLKGE